MTENKEKIFERLTKNSNSVEPKCSFCGGRGYMIVYKETEDSIRVYGPGHPIIYSDPCPICDGQKERKVERAKATADLPKKYTETKIEAFDWGIYRDEKGQVVDLSEHKAVIDDMIHHFNEWERQGMGLYIWSERKGTGKTMLACAVVNSIIGLYGKQAKYVSAPSILDILSKKENYDRDPLETFKTTRILIIDDLGAESGENSWFKDVLYKITDERMNRRLVTIITSNLRKDALPYDERIVDRINAMCTSVRLPKYSVRNAETKQRRMDFLKGRGLA